MKCINRSSKEFKTLQKDTNISELALATMIGKWQEQNNSDEFPSFNELLGVEPNSFSLFGENPELEVYGNTTQYGQYVKSTGNTNVDGFVDYQIDKYKNKPSNIRMLNENLRISDLNLNTRTEKQDEIDIEALADPELLKLLDKKDLIATDILDYALTLDYKNTSDSVKTLISRVKKIKDLDEIKVFFLSQEELDSRKASAFYTPRNSHSIYTSRKNVLNMTGERMLHVFLHEVVHARTYYTIKDPVFKDEDALIQSIQEIIDKYGSTNKDYGFTNVMEFAAELYSNPTFANKVKKLLDNDRPLLQRFLDAIRRLFNMQKPSKYDKLWERLVFDIETENDILIDRYDTATDDEYSIIKVDSEFKQFEGFISKLDTIKKDMLDGYLRQKDIVKRSQKKKSEIEEEIKQLDKKVEALEIADTSAQLEIVINYVEDLLRKSHGVVTGTSSLTNKLNNIDKFSKQVSLNEELLRVLDISDDILTLITNIQDEIGVGLNKNAIGTKYGAHFDSKLFEALNETEQVIKVIQGNRSKAETSIRSAREKVAINILKNKSFNTRIDAKYKEQFRKEYLNSPDLQNKFKSVDAYINNQFLDKAKMINDARETYAKEIVLKNYVDIGSEEVSLSDALNINSPLISALTHMVLEMKDSVIDFARPKLLEVAELHKKYVKSTGDSLNTRDKYKKLFTLGSNDKYYFTNKYKQEVLEQYNEANNRVREDIYGNNIPLSITDNEHTTLGNVGLQTLFRKSDEVSVKQGDIVNLRKSDKVSSINGRIQYIHNFGNYESLSESEKNTLARSLGFDNMQDVFDSKLYSTENSKGSKVNPNLYNYLKNRNEGSLDIVQYTRLENTDKIDFSKHPEMLKFYEAYTNLHFENIEDPYSGLVTRKEYRLVKDEFLNPEFENLTQEEKDVIALFQKEANESDKIFGKGQSLNKKINNVRGVNFILKPSVDSSTLEKRNQLDFKNIAKDQFERLKNNKNDDIHDGSAYYDHNGNKVRHLRPNYRNYVKSEDQSFEVFDMLSKEIEQNAKGKYRKDYIHKADIIINVSKDKNYLKKEKGVIAKNRSKTYNKDLKIDGASSNEYAKMMGMFETHFHDVHSYSDHYFAGFQANKLVGMVNGYAAAVALTFNEASGVANILNGMSQLKLDALSGGDINMKNLVKAEGKYTKELPSTLSDLTKARKESFVNQMLDMFNIVGGSHIQEQSYLKNKYINKFGSTGIMNSFNESGEHMMVSVLTMAMLDNIKVLNKNGMYIDSEGNSISDKSKGQSLLDVLYIDSKTGLLTIPSTVIYTTHTNNIELNKGGKTHISMYIKKRSHDLFGTYDPDLQGEVTKKYYGKLVMMYKRYFISGLQHRFRGYTKITKHPDEMTDADSIYNSSLKSNEEGYYTTFIKMMYHNAKNLKNLELSLIPQYYNSLTERQQANIRKTVYELVYRWTLLPALGFILASMGGDDDDKPYFMMYQVARLQSELGQFYNPLDMTKLATNPIAGLRIVQNALNLTYDLATPINFNPEEGESTFDYLNTDVHGNNKLVKSIGRFTPIWTRFFVDYADMTNNMNKY